MNSLSTPESLEDIYKAFFTERFNKDELKDFKPLLEVLLASNSPPELPELDEILNYHYKNYETRTIVLELSQYFKSDIDEGPLEFYHQLFAEWLINQTDNNNGIVVEKSKGHQYIVDYLLHFYSERQTNLTFEELSELCTHILHGGKLSLSNKRKLSFLNVSEIRGKLDRSILHDLARNGDSTDLIDELIKQFDSVDILDYWNQTPLMYAVKAGSYENVKLFIDNGANITYSTERFFCFYSVYPNNLAVVHDMNLAAAYKGYAIIAELLIESGANIEKEDRCGWKPLHLAALMGHFEIVQLYLNRTSQPDLISLHHAAARNHTEIVRRLLETGLRDKCLPCDTRGISLCVKNLIRFHHHCLCETALHAAVSGNYVEVTRLILLYGKASVNCKHGFSGRTPLMEALSRKNIEMVEVLISAGADINAECKSSTLDVVNYCEQIEDMILDDEDDEWIRIYSVNCYEPVCNGSRVIDFAFANGFWQMMIPFLSKEELNASSNNVRWSPATVAATYDQVGFINATYGRINSIPNMKTLLRYAAVCHSVKTLKHLLDSDDLSKFTTVYEDGKTLLHFAILGSSKLTTEACVPFSSSACVCPHIIYDNNVYSKNPLETLLLLTKVLVSQINKQDKYGRTALHYAAVHVFPETVEYLVKVGADRSVEDQNGHTALEFALREKPNLRCFFFDSLLSCRWTSDKVFEICNPTRFDVMTSYLLQNATIKKCDNRAKNLLDSLLIFHWLPLSLYELFKSGLDVSCAQEYFKRILTTNEASDFRWRHTHPNILEVFKIFEVNVEVHCDVPLTQSELHLVAYSRKFADPGVGNLFQPSVNDTPFPLQRFITSHPNAVEIFNECYDKEGYLAIHRAVQSSNLHAVSWFIEIGVDVSRKTKSNLTALALSVGEIIGPSGRDIVPERIFDKLLEKMQEKRHDIFHGKCNTELIDLSPLHVAGSHGMAMMEMIHREMPAIPLNCTNRDGIQPIYLAYLYHATESYILREDKQAFRNLGLSPETGPSKYPQREAEYHLIYNQYYLTPQEDLRHVLNHDGLFECPGIDKLLPHKKVIQEYRKLKGCTTRCWPSVLAASREFSSNFPYLDIQNITISNPFTDKFMDIVHHMAELRFHSVKMFHFNSKLWRKVTKAHSCVHTCSCFEIMQLLQEKFTSKPRIFERVGKLVAERMGWTDTSRNGDVKYRWPFNLLLKKALRTDKTYKYLEILSPRY